MSRYLCIHCHFYQPPRENPWLESVEYQESAYPFHDWNERITQECYRANGESRILDSDGHVVQLVNNYSKMSFNFGPTLLSWMEDKDPITYQNILDGDRLSQAFFKGHGSALAQAYNHMILPLAHRRDKETQVKWGIRDFETRFQRYPEALWLPETAVDTETLEVLAFHGMKYVILAPRQARAIRPIAESEEWIDVSGEKVDPKRPYLIRLPSGRSIAAFFYDGPLSRAVAFEGLLHNGGAFADRLMQGFVESDGPQILNIATDGETYGHHHRFGDMALAYANHYLETHQLVEIVNYGLYLELFPPQFEVQIFDNSSWSCVHGVERWRSDCGCNSGMKQGWIQSWRGPLREGFDQLRDRLAEPFETSMSRFTDRPWDTRDDYISVILDRSDQNVEGFVRKWTGRTLPLESLQTFLKLLEIQRHLLLMYTSCAWFFDEISGIETVQTLQYAYRAIELASEVLKLDLEPEFRRTLGKAPSNLPELQNGAMIYDRYVKPTQIDLLRLGAHFAVSSVFESYKETNRIYFYDVRLYDLHKQESGRARLALGICELRSAVTREHNKISFGVIYLGDHNVSAGVKVYRSHEKHQALVKESKENFSHAEFPNVIRTFDRYFGSSLYSIKDLFKDEQNKIVSLILKETMSDVETRLTNIYRNHYPLVCYLSDLHLSRPAIFQHIASYVHNRGVLNLLRSPQTVNTESLKKYFEESQSWHTDLDIPGLSQAYTEALESKMRLFETEDSNIELLRNLINLVKLTSHLPFQVDIGPTQNRFLKWFLKKLSENLTETRSKEWLILVQTLSFELKVRIPA